MISFLGGLAVFVLAAVVPLQHVRFAQTIGSTDEHYKSGNNVVTDIGGGRYPMMAHLSPGTIRVKVGDRVPR